MLDLLLSQTLGNASLVLLADRLDASDALMTSSHQLTHAAIADLTMLLAQVTDRLTE